MKSVVLILLGVNSAFGGFISTTSSSTTTNYTDVALKLEEEFRLLENLTNIRLKQESMKSQDDLRVLEKITFASTNNQDSTTQKHKEFKQVNVTNNKSNQNKTKASRELRVHKDSTSTIHSKLKKEQNISKTTTEVINLVNAKKQVNEEDLYEHVSEKVNISERSFIFIHGSKFKVSYLNRVPQEIPSRKSDVKRFRTFITNTDTADEETDEHVARNLGEVNSDVKPENQNLMYASANAPYPSGSLANYMEDEMNSLSKKIQIKNTNSIPKPQYFVKGSAHNKPSMKITNHPINPKQLYYHREKWIEDSRKPLVNKQAPEVPVIQSYDNSYPTPSVDYGPAADVGSEELLREQNMVEMKKEDPFKTKALHPDKNRDYLELLKPPMLRTKPVKVKASSLFHKNTISQPNAIQQSAIPQSQLTQMSNLNPFQQTNYKGHININAPFRMKNDVRSQNKIEQRFQGDGKSRDDNRMDFRPDNNEEPEFHDARLINKIEEMKNLDAVLFDNNTPQENNNDESVKNVMKGNSRPRNKCNNALCKNYIPEEECICEKKQPPYSKKGDGASVESNFNSELEDALF